MATLSGLRVFPWYLSAQSRSRRHHLLRNKWLVDSVHNVRCNTEHQMITCIKVFGAYKPFGLMNSDDGSSFYSINAYHEN